MKINHVVYFISFFLLFSCSNTAIISHHWANYVNSNPVQKELSSIKNMGVEDAFSLIQFEFNNPQKDSVVIITKTGITYNGIITKSDFDGYFIKIEKNREIYVGNFEIKSIQFIKSPAEKNILIDQENATLDSTVLKKGISPKINTSSTLLQRKIGAEESSSSNSENDVWNNANSEFEISKSANLDTNPQKNILNKRYAPFSILSLIFTILGFFTGFTFVLGLIFGAISLSRIKANPEKYKGKAMVKFSFLLSLGFVILFIGILLLALLLLSLI